MLSVIIITKNEECILRNCLESVKWAEEIVVVDSGSEDATVAIAKEYTEKVYCTEDWQGYGVQKQRALAYATGNWILNLDADESIDIHLKRAIQAALVANYYDAYRIPIRMNFYGKSLRFSSSPKRHIRLFKREGARFSDDIVHEKVVLPNGVRIGHLNSPIQHCSFRDVSHALTKINCYSSYSAKIRISEKKSIGFCRVFVNTGWMFFRNYFLQLGFLDGKAGLLLAIFNAQGTFYRGIKQMYPDKQFDYVKEE